MAAIDFPASLPRAFVQRGFSRDRDHGFFDVQPAVGAPYIMTMTRDRVELYTMTFVYKRDHAQVFYDFIENTLDGGRLAFNINARTEQGLITLEAQFTEDGYPQLSNLRGGVHTYTAQVRAKKISFTPLDLFLDGEQGMWVVTQL